MELIKNIGINEILLDETNLRGSHLSIEELAISISLRGLDRPITVSWSLKKNAYVVLDGHRRVLALRLLYAGKIQDEEGNIYSMPKNYRLQKHVKNYEDFTKAELLAYRHQMNHYVRPATDIELGTALLESLKAYCIEKIGCTYDVATNKQKTMAFDRVSEYFKPTPISKLTRALKTVNAGGSIEGREKINKLIEDGRITLHTTRAIGKFGEEIQPQIIDIVEDATLSGMTNTQITRALKKTSKPLNKGRSSRIDPNLKSDPSLIEQIKNNLKNQQNTVTLYFRGIQKDVVDIFCERAKKAGMTKNDFFASLITSD